MYTQCQHHHSTIIYVQKIKKQSMYRCPWDPQVVQPNKALHGTFLGPPHTVRPVGLGPGGPKKVPRINKVPRIANSVHTPLNDYADMHLPTAGCRGSKRLLIGILIKPARFSESTYSK